MYEVLRTARPTDRWSAQLTVEGCVGRLFIKLFSPGKEVKGVWLGDKELVTTVSLVGVVGNGTTAATRTRSENK